MASVDLGNGPVEFEVSFWTLLMYEEEFDGGDLIADMYSADGNVRWTTAIRALWACCKSADDSTPGIREWSRAITGVHMPTVLKAVIPAINDGLFRQGPAEP